MKKQNLWLIVAVLVVTVLPLWIYRSDDRNGLFEGADGQASDLISELAPGYRPWVEPWFEPPSGEIESALFSLQAALGGGFIGYFFGLRKGARRRG